MSELQDTGPALTSASDECGKAILELRSVVAGYGKKDVLRGVSFFVQRGHIASLIGPNGSGKSTCLRVIFGLVRPRSGAVLLSSSASKSRSPEDLARTAVAYAPQGGRVFPSLIVRQNLLVPIIRLDRKQQEQRVEEMCILFPRLADRFRLKAGLLSGGERQQLALAMAMIQKPELLLLDEPSAGLAPHVLDGVFTQLQRLSRQSGMTLLIAEQKVRQVLSIADQVIGLRCGEVAHCGELGQFDNETLRRIFLGDLTNTQQHAMSAQYVHPKTPMIDLTTAKRIGEKVKEKFESFPGSEHYPLPKVVAAYHLTDAQLQQLQDMVHDVHAYLKELLPKLQLDRHFLDESIVSSCLADEQRTLLQMHGAPPSPFLCRIDCLWDPKARRFRLCEINADAVGGVEDAHFLREVYDNHLPQNVVRKSRLPRASREIANYLRQTYGEAPGLIVYTDASCCNAGNRLAAALRSYRADVEVKHINDLPEELESTRWRWLWRHLLLTDLFEPDSIGGVPLPTSEAVLRFLVHCRSQHVHVLSPIRDRLVFDKRLLAEETALRYVSADTWSRASQWIIPTAVVDLRVDPLAKIPPGKVLKPAHGYGGKGILFEGESPPQERSRDFWVLQDLVDCEQIEGYDSETPDLQTQTYRTVHGIHLLNGTFIGDHIRLGTGRVARGSGGYIPAY